MSDPDATIPPVINERMLLPIGIAIAAVAVCVGAYGWLDSRFDQIEQQQAEQRMMLLFATRDRWTYTDMRMWSNDLKIVNPTLVVPKAELQRRQEDAQ